MLNNCGAQCLWTRMAPRHIWHTSHTHTLRNTQIQFPLINNVFVVHASAVIATCQLHLT